MTFTVHTDSFQSAFAAMSYFWGRRGEALGIELGQLGLHPKTRALLSDLGAPDRAARAAVLGAELGKLVTALEQQGLLR